MFGSTEPTRELSKRKVFSFLSFLLGLLYFLILGKAAI